MPAHFVHRGSCLGVVLESEVYTDRSTHEHVRHELLLKRCRAPNIMVTQTTNHMIHAIGWKTNTLENEAPTRWHNVPSHRLLVYRPVSENCVYVPLHLENHVTTPCNKYFVRPPQRHRTRRTIWKTTITTTRMSQTHNHGKLGFKIVTSVNRSANSNCEEFYLVPHNQTRDMCSDMSVNLSPKQLRGLSHEKKAKRTFGATHHSAATNMSMTACSRTDKIGTVTPCRP